MNRGTNWFYRNRYPISAGLLAVGAYYYFDPFNTRHRRQLRNQVGKTVDLASTTLAREANNLSNTTKRELKNLSNEAMHAASNVASNVAHDAKRTINAYSPIDTNEIQRGVRHAGEDLRNMAHNAIEKTADKVGDVADSVSRSAHNAAYNTAHNIGNNISDTVRRS